MNKTALTSDNVNISIIHLYDRGVKTKNVKLLKFISFTFS